MGFERPTGSTQGGDNTPIEKLGKGKFKARLVGVVSFGTYQDSYKGELKKPTDKMSLLLEIIGSTITLGDEEVPRTLWVRPFNYFSKLTERGNELKYYSAFDEMAEENDVPDWEAMMGKGCYVINKPVVKGDEAYDTVDSLVAMDEDVAENLAAAESELFIDSSDKVEGKLFGLAKYVHERPRYSEEPNATTQAAIVEEPDSDDDNPFG